MSRVCIEGEKVTFEVVQDHKIEGRNVSELSYAGRLRFNGVHSSIPSPLGQQPGTGIFAVKRDSNRLRASVLS